MSRPSGAAPNGRTAWRAPGKAGPAPVLTESSTPYARRQSSLRPLVTSPPSADARRRRGVEPYVCASPVGADVDGRAELSRQPQSVAVV